jgi:proprotein convertase subtilisin/kexin type 5
LCSNCAAGCATCSNPTTCDTCQTNSYPGGAGVCNPCDVSCATCSDSSSCDSCAVGYFANGAGLCVADFFNITSGPCSQFIDGNNRYCISSPDFAAGEQYPPSQTCEFNLPIARGLILEQYDTFPSDGLYIDSTTRLARQTLPYFFLDANNTSIRWVAGGAASASGSSVVHEGFLLCEACACSGAAYNPGPCVNGQDTVCATCNDGCELCQDGNTCTTCADGFYDPTPNQLNNDLCLENCCPSGQYPTAPCTGGTPSCADCGGLCQECSGPGHCQVCTADAMPDPENPTGCIQKLWGVTGPCVQTYEDGEYCIHSPNYGRGNYANSQTCTFEMNYWRPHQIQFWNVERGWDGLCDSATCTNSQRIAFVPVTTSVLRMTGPPPG